MNGNLDINILLGEYQNQVSDLTKDIIFLKAYITQLEKQLEEATKVEDDSFAENKCK